ncbi:hypothetical protein CASFOL_011347 [Castilleja foliolosa]|uniref:Reticulon-like protein n=1 Tax=Castilleja foliolosa TaxID=1961234 RepID=A0ABD3DVU2_9LAMI
MPEGITAEALMKNIMETVSDGVSKDKHVSFLDDEKAGSATSQINILFGREKPVHHLLGGGKFLLMFTIVWVLFEWLNYNFISLVSFVLAVGLLVQFFWKNASGIINRSPANVPRLVLPNEFFINIGKAVGYEVNRGLGFLQDVACEGNLKQFLVVVASLFAAAIIGSWCNFLTLIYIGFVAAHTLPILYERYEDEVDAFVYKVLQQFQHNYRKLDARVLSRIPTHKFRGKKAD